MQQQIRHKIFGWNKKVHTIWGGEWARMREKSAWRLQWQWGRDMRYVYVRHHFHQVNTCDLFSRNKAYKMFFTQFAKMRFSNIVIVFNSHFFRNFFNLLLVPLRSDADATLHSAQKTLQQQLIVVNVFFSFICALPLWLAGSRWWSSFRIVENERNVVCFKWLHECVCEITERRDWMHPTSRSSGSSSSGEGNKRKNKNASDWKERKIISASRVRCAMSKITLCLCSKFFCAAVFSTFFFVAFPLSVRCCWCWC